GEALLEIRESAQVLIELLALGAAEPRAQPVHVGADEIEHTLPEPARSLRGRIRHPSSGRARDQKLVYLDKVDDLREQLASRPVRERFTRLQLLRSDRERDAGDGRGVPQALLDSEVLIERDVLRLELTPDAAARKDGARRVVTVSARDQI